MFLSQKLIFPFDRILMDFKKIQNGGIIQNVGNIFAFAIKFLAKKIKMKTVKNGGKSKFFF
jgi:hypothetical protein